MNLNGEDNAKKFYLLWKGWSKCSSEFPNGVSDKTALAKLMDSSINPRKSTVAFVSELIDLGVVIFDKKGRLMFDDDRLDEFIRSNSCYNCVIVFFKRDKITI